MSRWSVQLGLVERQDLGRGFVKLKVPATDIPLVCIFKSEDFLFANKGLLLNTVACLEPTVLPP